MIVVLFVVLLICGNAQCFDKYDAYFNVEHQVKQQLMNPSDADFCGYSKATVTQSGNTYSVSGYVDATNAFGGKLRKRFSATIHVKGERYKVVSMSID